MKNKSATWILLGVMIGVITELASQNFSAALCLGSGSGMLTMILSTIKVEHKPRD